MLHIDKSKIRYIENQVIKSYPFECCGLLVGTNTSEKKVVEIFPLHNKNTERTQDRYEIDGREFDKIDRESSKKGLQIVGIYHSHPDHPSRPSAYDTDHAWVGYSYMIIAIEKGEKTDIRSWVFHEEEKQFHEEELKVYE